MEASVQGSTHKAPVLKVDNNEMSAMECDETTGDSEDEFSPRLELLLEDLMRTMHRKQAQALARNGIDRKAVLLHFLCLFGEGVEGATERYWRDGGEFRLWTANLSDSQRFHVQFSPACDLSLVRPEAFEMTGAQIRLVELIFRHRPLLSRQIVRFMEDGYSLRMFRVAIENWEEGDGLEVSELSQMMEIMTRKSMEEVMYDSALEAPYLHKLLRTSICYMGPGEPSVERTNSRAIGQPANPSRLSKFYTRRRGRNHNNSNKP